MEIERWLKVKKLTLILLCGLVLFGTLPAYGAVPDKDAEVLVNNLAPRTQLQYTTEPKPRKVDLVFDLRETPIQKQQLEQMIDQHLVPELEKKDLDYHIQVIDHEDEPFFSVLGGILLMVDHEDYIYYFTMIRNSNGPNDYFPFSINSTSQVLRVKPSFPVKAAYSKYSSCSSDCSGPIYIVSDDGKLYEYSFLTNSYTLFPEVSGVEHVVVRGYGYTYNSESVYVLTQNGELYAKGNNQYGQLGVGDTNDRSTFVRVPVPGKVTFVTAHYSSNSAAAMAINDKGEVYLFGSNANNVLLQGSGVANVTSPRKISGIPKMRSGAIGRIHGYLLDEQGRLWSWGERTWDTLQRDPNVFSPTLIPYDKRFREVFISSSTNVLVDTDSNVYLGGFFNGSSYGIDFNTPYYYKAKKVIAGDSHGMILIQDGNYMSYPVIYTPLKVKDFSLGEEHALAVTMDGLPLSGGAQGTNGVFGDGSSASGRLAKLREVYNLFNNDVLRNFEKVFALPNSSFAIDKNGDVWAWGKAGDVFPPEFMVDPIGIPKKTRLKGIKKMYGIEGHIYAIMENGDLYSWSTSNFTDSQNILGHGKNVTASRSPRKVSGLSDVVDLGVFRNGNLVYAVTGNGKLYVFGGGSTSIQQVDAPPNLVQVETNQGGSTSSIVMVLDAGGQVWAKGTSNDCLLALGDRADSCSYQSSADFIKIRNLDNIKEISLGDRHALAIDKNDELWGWGKQAYAGELFYPNQRERSVNHPVKITQVRYAQMGKVKQIFAGKQMSFVVDASGVLWGGGTNNRYPGNLLTGKSISDCSYCSISTMIGSGYERALYSLPSYREVIGDAQWRNGSDKYYIALENGSLREHDDPRLLAADVQALLSRNIRFIGIADAGRKDSMRRIIQANNDRGLYLSDSDMVTALKRVGIYAAKNLSIDVHFHLGRTSHDDRNRIRSMFDSIVRPTLESYGIEARMAVTDGERKKENRLFYVSSNDNKLYYFDPGTKTSKLLINDTVASFAIGPDGSIYYHNNTGIRKFNEKLGTNVLLTSVVPASHIAVDHEDNVYYVFYRGSAYGYGLYKLDPRTGEATLIGTYAYITELSTSWHGHILYLCNGNAGDGYLYACAYNPKTNSFSRISRSGEGAGAVVWNNPSYIYTKRTYYIGWDIYSPALPPSTVWYKESTTRPFLFPIKTNGGTIESDVYPSRRNNVFYFSMRRFMYEYIDPSLWYDGLVYTDGNTLSSKQITRTVGTIPEIYAETPDLKLYFSENGTWKYFDPVANSTVTVGTLPIKKGAVANGFLFYPQGSYDETKWLKKTEIQSELQTAQWRTGADRFYVNISDGSLEELQNSTKRNTIIQKLSDTETVYVQLGRSANKAQAEQVIQQVGYGTYIDNTDLNAAFGSLATFLVENAGLNRSRATGKVILEYDPDTGTYMSDKLVFSTGYEDPENDKIFTFAWKFDHDPDYYENSLGLLDDAGRWLPSPYEYLTKPGKYTITYRAQDNPKNDYRFDEFRKWGESKLEILAHRRPIAMFTPNVTESSNGHYSVSITEASYDPDRQSAANRGIAEKVWKWKKASDAEWTAGMIPSKVPAGEVYFISLTVRDTDGAWSLELIKDIYAGGKDQPPVAGFTVNPAITYRGVQVTIDSQAYDQEDGDRTKLPHAYYIRNLTLNDAEALASTSRTSWTKTFNTIGTIQIRQVVTDSAGQTDQAVRTVTILNRKPQANVTTPASADPANPTKLTVLRPAFAWTYSDPDGDTQKQYQVQIYRMNGVPELDSGAQSGGAKNWTPAVNLPEKVNLYVQVRVHDGYEWSDWSAPKYFYIETNRPPVADFDWTPKPVYEGDTVQLINRSSDPDGDPLTYDWQITAPGGDRLAFTTREPSFRAMRPGSHAIRLTVSDGKATAQANRTLEVLPLTITGEVHHTPEWRARHAEAGHEVERDPKDFYSGEIIRVAAVISAAPANEVTAELRAVSQTGLPIRKKVVLTAAGGLRYEGELHDESWMSPDEGIREGEHTVVFQVAYRNGVTKETSVPIRIIGNIYKAVSVHRVQ